MQPATLLAILGVAFVGLHLVLSHPPVRTPLRARLGDLPFRGVYSLGTLAVFVPMAWLWWTNRHAGATLWYFPELRHLTELINVFGFALLVGGAASPAPAMMMTKERAHYDVTGMTAITRHPVGWGFALVGIGHLLVNGFVGDIAFWGSLVALGLVGTLHQDARQRVEREGYAELIERTTWWPSPTPSRLVKVGATGWAAAAVGVAVAVALRWAHRLF